MSSIEKIEKITVERGSFAFLWFNRYAGVVVKTPGYTLVIDPVEVDPGAFGEVDAILVTHEHYDHLDCDVVRRVQARTGCDIIADPTSAQMLSGFIPSEKLRIARAGEALLVGEVMINAEESNHPPASTPLTFVLTTEDGLKIYHTSDSLSFPRMANIGERFRPDIAFCTVGIAPGASPKTGVGIAALVKPKVAIPYHGTDFERFAELLRVEAPDVKCMIIKRDEVYRYP